jgi:XTP/dITP diphosphohydrolase
MQAGADPERPMRVLLASGNKHKLREFVELLPGVDLVAWQGPPIPEDGAFFHDNALQKALFARDWCAANGAGGIGGLDGPDGVMADDSGLCVDALFGGPGVLSARFAPRLSYPEKNRLLLSMVAPGETRSCRFVCVIAFAPMPLGAALRGLWPGSPPFVVSGTVEGALAEEPRGEGGFGYDPIFIPAGHGATFGELGADIKNSMSHRGRAAREMLKAIGCAGSAPDAIGRTGSAPYTNSN